MIKLQHSFYNRDPVTVAKELLGKYLVHTSQDIERIGRIVEVEAYLGPHDLASHASRGVTARTRVLYGPSGHAYVYLIYGKYNCMNVVTGPNGQAGAVLLRALEPVRNISARTRGPGLLCAAMDIDRRLNACDLTADRFHIADDGATTPLQIVRGTRIGVAYAGPWALEPLRFLIKDNRFVSKPVRS